MFGDWYFIESRLNDQECRFAEFCRKHLSDKSSPFAVIEIGAERAVPTVRWKSENLVRHWDNGVLI